MEHRWKTRNKARIEALLRNRAFATQYAGPARAEKRPSRRTPTGHLLAPPMRVGVSARDVTSSFRPDAD
jgi:hypothetical protein